MYANIPLKDPITGKRKINWARVAFILASITIPVLMWLFTYVFVNLKSFVMAFQYNSASGETVFTLRNFTLLFDEFSKSTSLIREAFRNTMLTFALSIVMLFVGFFVSYFLYKKVFFYKGFRTIFFIPTVLAGTIVSSVFKMIVSVDGPIVELMMKLGEYEFPPELLNDSRYANTVVFVNYIIFNFAGNMIIWGGSFSRIPDSIIESGRMDGLNWLGEAFYITIPMIWPTFTLTLLLAFCGFFGASGNVFLLTRGQYGTMTLNCWMYLQVLDQHDNSNALNYMSAVGFMMTVISITITLFIRWITSKINADIQY